MAAPPPSVVEIEAFDAYMKKVKADNHLNGDDPQWRPDNSKRLDNYIRYARQNLMQARQYRLLDNSFNEYVYLHRFALLALKTIVHHNAANTATYRRDVAWAKKEVKGVLDELAACKTKLQTEFIADRAARARAAASSAHAPSAPPAPPAYSAVTSTTGAPEAPPAVSAEEAALNAKLASLKMGEGAGAGSGYSGSAYPSGVKTAHHGTTSSSTTGSRSSHGEMVGVGGGASANLRRVEIPVSVLHQFLAIADPNTRKGERGVETCGILAGRVGPGDVLQCTTLVVPKQEGGPDTCGMTDETELYDFCMSRDLLTLGWIHTHPRQECFLSSVDLHTHCGFQSMMPEAVAIVLAPCDTRCPAGVFRLTSPGGIRCIQRCTLSGFHPHKERDLYFRVDGGAKENKFAFVDGKLATHDLR